ncbi:RanBD1 domain-containing protein [Psidium guajava]|nr:RanBD1 domain-containing protein [Psidium guajava]
MKIIPRALLGKGGHPQGGEVRCEEGRVLGSPPLCESAEPSAMNEPEQASELGISQQVPFLLPSSFHGCPLSVSLVPVFIVFMDGVRLSSVAIFHSHRLFVLASLPRAMLLFAIDRCSIFGAFNFSMVKKEKA